MKQLRSISIRTKLTLICVVTSTVVLLVASSALYFYELRTMSYAVVVVATLLVSIFAAFVLASLLIRFITRPIVELAGVAKRVSQQEDYGLRARKTSNDELGDLIDSFNEMLEQIQRRDTRLEEHRGKLEEEVAARTEEIRKLSLAVEQSPNVILITDAEGTVEYVNQRFTDITGYSVEEALADGGSSLKTGTLGEEEVQELMETLKNGGEWRGEFQNRKKSGELYWESVAITPLRTAEGDFDHHVWSKEDITERKKAEDALRESEERYALAALGANDGLWDWNLGDDTIYYSARWKAMLGHSDDEIGVRPDEWFSRVHSADIEEVRAKIDEHLEGGSPHFEHEFRMLHRDGKYRWMLSRGVSVLGEDGRPHRFAGSQTDITDRKMAEEKLFHEAAHDNLTGLPNRGLFLERLSGAMLLARRRPNVKYAVLFLDLDRFKIVNDSLGHLVGDQLLVQASMRLRLSVRGEDVIARMGGDEFAILLENIGRDKDPVLIAERIQQDLSVPFYLDDNEVYTSASIGIALSTQGYEKAEDILRDSDTAMYRAKSMGRARFAMFDADLHEQATARLQLETDLRRAVEREEELLLYYQPIYSLTDNVTVGFEALARWQHPERGLVSPVEFIPVAEETGLIAPMGWWIIGEASSQLAQWHEQESLDSPLSVSINVSGKQFLEADFTKKFQRILNASGIKGSDLKVEITETAIVENPESAATILAELKALGLTLCIDDFGTGYSSLAYLHRFPFDVLKIDRTFIGNMLEDQDTLEIVQAIMSLSRSLGLEVIAEGVETSEQLEALRALKCGFIQGFYLSKPMPAEDVPAFLKGPYGTKNKAAMA